MARITEHRNAHLSTDNMHEVKGFPNASNGYSYRKGINGLSSWLRDKQQPNALGRINGYEAPTTEIEGDIYTIESPELDVNAITWQSATTVRFTFTTGYTSTLYAVNSYLQISGALFENHNGIHLITTVNASYLEVTIALIVDATDDDAAGSPAVGYVTHEDFDPESLSNNQSIPRVGQVKYYGTADLWFGDASLVGDSFYNVTTKKLETYNGTNFTSSLIKNSRFVFSAGKAVASDEIIYVDSSGGIFDLDMEDSPETNRELTVIDKNGTCGTNTITIDGNGNNINGSTTTLMNLNYDSVTLIYNGDQWNLK